ncbi:MAG: recombinase family protein [Pseudonocardiaceae bacterium]
MTGSANSMKTGISYLRVSTKEQAEKGGQVEGYSIPAQREAVCRKAESIGAVIVDEFVDAGESAKSAHRPDLQRMLRYLAENRVDYVIVHKVDRLARNRVDDVEISLAIKKAGATLVSATENIDETPSGMLLHGIMSSIAEFYSRNLATEVHKGMSQKARTGGTPGKAPLGYLNVARRTSEGREERTVEIDPDRAELITWAFLVFATGEWTLRSLADELETRGLTTRRTPKLPSRPVKPNVLHAILTNPYYKGEVVYRGVIHQGIHQPLIDPVTWQKVQDVLASHLVGERQRDHLHYLKSSVFCGNCGSRLIITNAKNRYGVVYPYFVCLGRHMKTTACTRKALLIAKIEKMVEDHWATVRLDPSLRDAVEDGLRAELATRRQDAEREHKHLTSEKAKLTSQRQKLVEAIYSGAMPLDLIATEQQRISSQLAGIEERLSAGRATFDEIEANLATALDLARDCHAAYLAADSQVRRLFNQAFFTHLYIDDVGLRSEYAEPFDTLLDQDVLDAGRAIQADRETGQVTMADILGRPATSTNDKTPRALRAAGGLSVRASAPVRCAEGSSTSTLVPPAGLEPAA